MVLRNLLARYKHKPTVLAWELNVQSRDASEKVSGVFSEGED